VSVLLLPLLATWLLPQYFNKQECVVVVVVVVVAVAVILCTSGCNYSFYVLLMMDAKGIRNV
jgi:predicted benzoate:H+ symporter BenE